MRAAARGRGVNVGGGFWARASGRRAGVRAAGCTEQSCGGRHGGAGGRVYNAQAVGGRVAAARVAGGPACVQAALAQRRRLGGGVCADVGDAVLRAAAVAEPGGRRHRRPRGASDMEIRVGRRRVAYR